MTPAQRQQMIAQNEAREMEAEKQKIRDARNKYF